MKYIKHYIITAIMLIPWVINYDQFTNCYENGNTSCEIIHGAGVFVPPLSLLTMWSGIDER